MHPCYLYIYILSILTYLPIQKTFYAQYHRQVLYQYTYFIYLSIYLSIYIYMYIYLSTYLVLYQYTNFLSIYLYIYILFILTYLPIQGTFYRSIYRSIYLPIYLSIYLFIYLIYLSTYLGNVLCPAPRISTARCPAGVGTGWSRLGKFKYTGKYASTYEKSVLRINFVLIWIRIREFTSGENGSGSDFCIRYNTQNDQQ